SMRRLAWAMTTGDPVPSRGNHVSQHRACGRCTTRTLPVEHEFARSVGLDIHGVERPVDTRELMIPGQHHRMDPRRYGLRAIRIDHAFTDSQWFHHPVDEPGGHNV